MGGTATDPREVRLCLHLFCHRHIASLQLSVVHERPKVAYLDFPQFKLHVSALAQLGQLRLLCRADAALLHVKAEQPKLLLPPLVCQGCDESCCKSERIFLLLIYVQLLEARWEQAEIPFEQTALDVELADGDKPR